MSKKEQNLKTSKRILGSAADLCAAYNISPNEVTRIDISIGANSISSVSFHCRPHFDNVRLYGIIDNIAEEARVDEADSIISSHNF